jgi:ATP-dependent helicase/nuclease subunit B
MYDWLTDALRGSSQIVTASRRLARQLATEFGQQQQASGKLAWQSPAVYAWQDWMAVLLASAEGPDALPTRINTHQSRVLWERCLRREINDPLLNISMLVRQSRDSWTRLREFLVPLDECERAAQGKDQRIFARAAANYVSILSRENWIDDASVADLVTSLVRSGRIELPPRLTVAGFDRVVPQVSRLLEAASNAGTPVEHRQEADNAAKGKLLSFENTDSELRAAGAWCRQMLQQDPHQRVAVVVTNLEQDAERHSRLVREGLSPGWQWGSKRYRAAVNVSFGRKLSEYPACAIALLLLRWLHSELTSHEVSLLLRSTVTGRRELGGRSRLELQLRRLPDRHWTPAMLLREFEGREKSADTGDWLARLEALDKLRKELPRRESPSVWAVLFDTTLNRFNWPGDESLDSEAFQLVNRWRELLNDLARLELVSPSLTAAEALGRLMTMAGETVFQPEVEDTLVQLLGPQEAAGMEFDQIWVSGLSSASWPPPGRPLALVSRTLQRSHGMPDAEPQDTLEYARRVLARLAASAPAYACSYALTDGDAQQTATGLLAEHDLETGAVVTDPGWHAATLVTTSDTCIEKSDPVPAVTGDEQVSGGAASLQRQLEEPFSAFVMGRLGVRTLQAISQGLVASFRGNLIHDALYRLYRDIPAQAEITAWDQDETSRRIERAADSAFSRHELNADVVLRALLQLEKRRVCKLLQRVVALDQSRDSFRIAAVEQSLTATIEGIRLKIRVDRIDHVENGELVILDYKTGTRKQFLAGDGAPRDMQLVVYACAVTEPVSDLGIVNVDSRAVDIDGAGRMLTPDLDWNSALTEWRERVEAGAVEMHRGDIRLYGLHSLQAARPLALLSRVREIRHDA